MVQKMHVCVIDIGNSRVKLALFKEDKLTKTYAKSHDFDFETHLPPLLLSENITDIFISSSHDRAKDRLVGVIQNTKTPYQILNEKSLSLTTEVDSPEDVGHDRIANAYGALSKYPSFDCIIVDIAEAVTFDLIAKEGKYLGGAIYPGMEISSDALSALINKLPKVAIEKPASALGKTTKEHIQRGIYFGLLGAIERIVAEISQSSKSHGSVKVIATGQALTTTENSSESELFFIEDLKELTDLIDPHLTLEGLYQIYKEQTNKNKET